MMYADLQLASDKEEHTLYTFDEKVITDAIKRIYHNEGYKPEMIAEREGKALIDENYRILSQAIDRGIAQYQTEPNDISGHITTEVPAELTAALHNNALLFSGWKGARTMHEAGIHLYNDKGGIKSFEEFSREAGEVFKKQKLNLTAEYRLATQSAAMAAKWSEVEADGDRYNLQYRTAGDSRVREEHARLDGTTLPPSDDFWAMFYPPNGWGCRCTAVQVRKSKYPLSDSKEAIKQGNACFKRESDKIFKFNPGKEQRLFPKKHPYFPKGCEGCDKNLNLAYDSTNEQCKTCAMINKCIEGKLGVQKLSPEEKEKIYALPIKEQYTTIPTNKGVLLQHRLVCQRGEDYNRVLDAAKLFAAEYGECRINPIVNKKATVGRNKIYPSIDGSSNPDLWVKGVGYVDVKSPENNIKAIRNANAASRDQSAIACITDHRIRYNEKNITYLNRRIFEEDNNKNYKDDIIFWAINSELLKFKRPK